MDSYNLNFETEELLKNINDKYILIPTNAGIGVNNKKTWIKDLPSIVSDISLQLKKFFEISNKRKLVFSLYNFEEGVRTLQIHPQNYNVVDRIIISTVDDQMKTSKGEKINMKSWEAYYIPKKFKQSTDIYFDNSLTYKLNGVKVKREKEKRYIMVFEYYFNKDEILDIKSLFENNDDNKVDDMVNDFLKLKI
jgi:hypothetical protein